MGPCVGGDLRFRIGFTGNSGHVWAEPVTASSKDTPLGCLPDLTVLDKLPQVTSEPICRRIGTECLTPALPDEVDIATGCGKHWDFDWYGEGFRRLDPFSPQVVVVPVYEPPFRRTKRPASDGVAEKLGAGVDGDEPWIPGFEEVLIIF